MMQKCMVVCNIGSLLYIILSVSCMLCVLSILKHVGLSIGLPHCRGCVSGSQCAVDCELPLDDQERIGISGSSDCTLKVWAPKSGN